MKNRKLCLVLILLLAANVSTAATPAPGPGNGFEDYLCRMWQGFEICRVKPGKGPK